MKILWFKKNLRTLDNEILSFLSENDRALGVYFFEPSILNARDFSNFHLQFILESLEYLESSLEKLNIPLLFIPFEARDGFEYLKKYFDYTQILSHEETGNWLTYERDKDIIAWSKKEKIKFTEFPNNGVVRRLKSRNEWNKIWNTRMSREIVFPQKLSEKIGVPQELQNLSQKTFSTYFQSFEKNKRIQTGGEKEAQKVLQSFLSTRSKNYIYSISKPELSASGCSRLSPYIANGNISLKYIFQKSQERILELKKQESDESKKRIQNIDFFLSRIHWQSHFIQKLEDEPEMEWRNINTEFDIIRQKADEELIEKVFAGMSGIPFIDAIARCLKHTGRINFRARATFVSFLCNTCMQPWQSIGGKLAQVFTDYEPGIHYPQLQMQAGTTGMNTIRIYNPIKQALEKDQDARFIRYWIPEIAHLPNEVIADPRLHPRGLEYPKALVDVEEANRQARVILWGLKKKKETKEKSKKVFEKHGSRVFRGKNKKKELLQITLFE